MKKVVLWAGICLVLAACNTYPEPSTQGGNEENQGVEVAIDWVDFVHWEGKQYQGAHGAVLADPEFLGEKVGEVEFKVAENVSDPAYQTKNGDAAFWEKGTAIYGVKNTTDVIAIPDAHEVNSYSLYFFGDAKEKFSRNFKDLHLEEVDKVEFHQGYNTPELLSTLTEKERLDRLFGLLKDGHIDDTYSGGDAEVYPMIFYTGEPVAYNFPLFFDEKAWFWHPQDTEFISNEIEGLIYRE